MENFIKDGYVFKVIFIDLDIFCNDYIFVY